MSEPALPEGLTDRIAEAEHVMSDKIGAAMAVFSASVTAAMHERAATIAAAIAESDRALRDITALFHGRAAVEMPDTADGPGVGEEGVQQ